MLNKTIIKKLKANESYKEGLLVRDLINKMILAGHDISVIVNNNFNYSQVVQIYEGMKLGLNWKKYAKAKYNRYQMNAYKKALIAKLDTSIFDKHSLNHKEMEAIVQILTINRNLDYSIILDGGFNELQLKEIAKGILHGVDVKLYAKKSKYEFKQMIEIRLGLEHGIQVSEYLNPNNKYTEMRKIRLELEKEKLNQLMK